jgi:predicted PurR-regulated permease PerM
LTQGIDVYVRSRNWIPSFLHDDILKYISTMDSASLIQGISENLGNIVNLSSSYLKTIGSYAMNIFGNIFFGAGKIVLFFTLCIFFSLSHFEVRNGITFLFRGIKQSKEKIDEVYTGIAARLRSQLLLCVFIGITSYVGLWILDWIGFPLPYKGVLALLAGIFEIIPYL